MVKYLFEQEELTCISLENELGLNRGDIVSITTYPEGAVEVETRANMTTTNQDKMKGALLKRGLPKGKKRGS